MKILITGSNGQVGSDLVQSVRASGEVSDFLATSRASLDFTDRSEVIKVVGNFSPSVIIHCGAMTNVDGCEDDTDGAFLVNAIGTRNIKHAARKVGAKVVYLSSDYVFDGSASEPINEWSKTNPVSVYGASKLAGETELESSDLIVRTSWVMGFNGKNILKTIINLAHRDGIVSFVDDQFGSPTVVSDLVRTLLALIQSDQSGVFHISNAGSTSWYEFTQFVFHHLGYDVGRVLPISSSELDASRKAKRPSYSVLDNCALRLGGYSPMPNWQQSVAKLCDELAAAR